LNCVFKDCDVFEALCNPHEDDSFGIPQLAQDALALKVSVDFVAEIAAMPEPASSAAYAAFYSTSEGIDGCQAAHKGQAQLGRLHDIDLTYGEVQFCPFHYVLTMLAQPSDGEQFVDLGSGTGRAVVAAALAFSGLHQCFGIEIVPTLCNASRFATERATASGCPIAKFELHECDFRTILGRRVLHLFGYPPCVWPKTLFVHSSQKL